MFRTEDSQILGAAVPKFSRPGDLTPGICAPLHHLLHGLLCGLFPRALFTKSYMPSSPDHYTKMIRPS